MIKACPILLAFFILIYTDFSQAQSNLLNKTVKVDILNGSIESLLNEISTKGEFSFSCSNYIINLEKKVYLNSNTQTVKAFLDEIFSGASIGVDYLEKENKIILKPHQVPKKFITISGKVLDNETGRPVVNSNINIAGSYLGTTTDSLGNYDLKLKVMPSGERLIINYSHISYNSESVVINTAKSEIVDVKLGIRILTLLDVPVFGFPQIAFKNKSYHIEDYELVGDNILLTVYEKRLSKSDLFLINSDQEFQDSKKIPGTPIGTYKDCMDDIHLVTYYHPFEVVIDSGKMTIQSSKQTAVNRLTKPCAAIGPNGLYYYYFYGPARLSVEYGYHDEKNNKEKIFRIIEDTTQMARYKDKPDILKDIFSNSRGSLADVDVGKLNKTYHPNFEHYFVDTLYKPVYAPMVVINNKIYIFNHVEDKIEVYNLLANLIKIIPISYHLDDGWMPRIFHDKDENRVFTRIQREGHSTIYEIDLNTGELKNPFKITFNDIEKIQVHSGRIYFLYKSPDSKNNQFKCLYQQKLYLTD